MRRRLVPAVSALMALGLLLGCGAEGSGARAPSSASPPVVSGPPVDKVAQLKASMLAEAEAVGEAPAGAPASDVTQGGGTATLMWETAKGRLCLAQASVTGGSDVRRCADLERIVPTAGARVTRAFGTLSTPDGGWAVVLLAERGVRMTSGRFSGKAVEWTHVRTLAPEHSGRALYYLTLSGRPVGELVVALDVGGREQEERLTLH
ncbi:hypothetical protein [Streptomyces venezuelae]|uniref:hypothetical protein n=1 Tax=Streptomyces venezuelae TaxID=54571 RepID=UPI00278BB156|nr:hypothetical protein [Streptomyces venezuelae]